MTPKYHSTESIAAILQVSTETVRRYLASGELGPVYVLGSAERPRYRVSDAALQRFIRSRKRKPK